MGCFAPDEFVRPATQPNHGAVADLRNSPTKLKRERVWP